MTLGELRAVLAMIPTDCDELPLCFTANGWGLHVVRIVTVDPPGNVSGYVPLVTFREYLAGVEPGLDALVMGGRTRATDGGPIDTGG